jgi:hypothetical protein
MRAIQALVFSVAVLALPAASGEEAQIDSLAFVYDEPLSEEQEREAAVIYDVDDDRDGRIDRQLILEQSDTLA